MANQATEWRVALALGASMPMFAGWVLAIVLAFHNLAQVAVVVVLGLLLFTLVFIPADLGAFHPRSG